MEKPIVLIGMAGSPLAGEVAACLDSTAAAYYTLSLDAPLEGRPVTVAPGAVVWEGVDLLQGGAIFVEKPVFPWPQMQLPTEPFHLEFTHEQWVVFQREASSLVVSALLAAAEVRPVINPPAAAHLAVAPSIALDRLARDGIRIHPWSLEPAPSRDRSGAGFVLDACGRDRWHSPRRPPAGEPALVLEPFPGEVVTFIVVGRMPVGALRYDSGGAWAEAMGMDNAGEQRRRDGSAAGKEREECGTATGEDRPEPLDDPHSIPEAADLAIRAAAVLGLDFAAVSIRTGVSPHSILLCEAGPDLASWNRFLDGRLAAALADHLTSAASK